MVGYESELAGAGQRIICSWGQAIAAPESLASRADAATSGSTHSDLNTSPFPSAEESEPFPSQTKSTTTSASPERPPSFLSKVFVIRGRANRKASHTDDGSTTSIELQEIHRFLSCDSGICLDNKTLDNRFETGSWYESFVEAFDNDNRTFINTVRKLENFLPILLTLKESTIEQPELSCDCEGCKLGRHGSLTIFQMRIRSLKHTYVFDVLALGGRVMFETEGEGGTSLKQILESLQVKVFWDVRQDSDALFHHFGIRLDGVVDAQLMELASRRTPDRDRIFSLFTAVSIEWKAWMGGDEFWEWKRSFRAAKDYFSESNYECFNIRPLTTRALSYSAGDGDCIENLYDIYLPRMNERFWTFVHAETEARIALSFWADMPEGCNLAPASISTIPYEWPAIVDEWPTDPTAVGNATASTAQIRLIATTNTLGTSKERDTFRKTSGEAITDDNNASRAGGTCDAIENMMCESTENMAWQSCAAAPSGVPHTKKEFRWGDPEPEWISAEIW